MRCNVSTGWVSIAVLCVGARMSAFAFADERDHARDRPEARAPTSTVAPMVRAERANARLGASGRNRPASDGRGEALGVRYPSGRSYPPVGSTTRAFSGEYRPYYRGNERYYFNDGVWYAPRGPGFVVVRPPPGLVISVLPSFYSTVWIGGSPYYYADDVYYTWQADENGYAVADPPVDTEPSSPPDMAAPQQDWVTSPTKGQSKEQQAADEVECQTWATGQTGFDPSRSDNGASAQIHAAYRGDYDRARLACLQGRGYAVD